LKLLPEGFARWLPVVLLVLVALNQQRLAHTASLSPWSGGGFGMFSTIDSPAARHLHVFLETEGIRRELDIPRQLAQEARRATTLPTRARLERFAAALTSEQDLGKIAWEDIDVQVWGVNYDPDSLTPTGVLLARERFELAGH
jgi:hypothetical protein